jgi:hypothetical protein
MMVNLKILKGPVNLDAALNPSFVTTYISTERDHLQVTRKR